MTTQPISETPVSDRDRGAVLGHWPEILIEGALLGGFMVSACLFATLLEHPGSPVRQAVGDPLARRALMGLAMGLTAVGLIYSPWGKRSGAHMNTGVTLTFWRLGRVPTSLAAAYVASQVIGAVLGVLVCAAVLGAALSDSTVMFVVTRPGAGGEALAFGLELAISFGMMAIVLIASNNRGLTRYTGLLAGLLLAAYITFEAPYSGTSINAARSIGSAIIAGVWDSMWVYLTAPALGMLVAGELYSLVAGRSRVYCAKLHHVNDQPCPFACRFAELYQPPVRVSGAAEAGPDAVSLTHHTTTATED